MRGPAVDSIGTVIACIPSYLDSNSQVSSGNSLTFAMAEGPGADKVVGAGDACEGSAVGASRT
jgi:hypothetical protein